MAYTTPTTRSLGALITSSIWNTDLVDNIIYLKVQQDIIKEMNPVGMVQPWVTETPPSKWLLCDGADVSRTTYADLFGVVGTDFGIGDGSTTFGLPDARGRVLLGQDDMGTGEGAADRVTDTEADTIGDSEGSETVTLVEADIPSHDHEERAHSISSGSNTRPMRDTSADGDAAAGLDTGATGGGGAHANLQPYLTMTYIIYTGV